MVSAAQQMPDDLSAIFLALADPTRRAVIARLGQGPASVSELASPFDMGLPSFMKHIRLLENNGMIRTKKAGRTRTCVIDGPGLTNAERWLVEQRRIWEAQADRLEAFVMLEQKVEANDADRDR
ncbi:metalloregulator ArsR/SmtB family transcription factor [Pelagibacterium sp. 26DY04]|uniref:ArsR/SmtB family transcription factor n=1 Tax=Pelagibacterium sp. 26DY04 TaxID=2967130 RepID=UPI002814EA64|nr:metalloregulator ArsR/SmtB family transcription factor [Pelagibacterium sp. 26DY04]WMT86221.1 metalloregulator ArsR/SmtB family transcription factor [Pelagibacterium sp. 26DY04]